jgi:phospholipid N-methyltransferase
MADKIDPDRARVVVELGPGDGVITEFILQRLKPDATLFIFEINDAFVEKMRVKFTDPRVVLIHDSAEHMGRYFEKYGIARVDYVVSAIPFVMLPESVSQSIIGTCRRWLAEGGLFIQFHYSKVLVNYYQRMFSNATVDFVPLNIPPAFIITCEKNGDAPVPG